MTDSYRRRLNGDAREALGRESERRRIRREQERGVSLVRGFAGTYTVPFNDAQRVLLREALEVLDAATRAPRKKGRGR